MIPLSAPCSGVIVPNRTVSERIFIMAHVLQPLTYPFNALEPYIDAMTMEIHHDKHHATYVAGLNTALEGLETLAALSVEALLKNLKEVPEAKRQAVINHGGGVANHNMFWKVMGPNCGGTPTGEVLAALNGAFGSFEIFKEKFETAAKTRFGSGWAWLVKTPENKLEICSTANQDTPLSQGNVPLLTLDVWEHAYYLKYQNRRPEYISAFWNVVNWNEVAARLKG
jgi:Fe-Mn family superoxide dismutase